MNSVRIHMESVRWARSHPWLHIVLEAEMRLFRSCVLLAACRPFSARRGLFTAAASAVLAAFVVSTAWAYHPPNPQGPRPGPYAFEVRTDAVALEAVGKDLVHPLTGATVSAIQLNAGPYAGSPETVAKTYLRERSDIFVPFDSVDDLTLDRVRTSPGSIHVRFAQTVDGIRVWGAGVIVTLDESGRYVQSVTNEHDPLLAEIDTSPALEAWQAEREARAAVWITEATPLDGTPAAPELFVLRGSDQIGSSANLAWRVSLPLLSEPRGDWEVFVDARTGAILRVTDRTCFVDGSGYTFDPDPLTTAQVPYGSIGYTDGSDADTAQLTAQRAMHALQELTYSGGVYQLQGPWVYIGEFEAPTSTPVTSPTPDGFTYTRNQQGFEDVNAYFHLDQSQRHIQSLGFDDIQHAPIDVDTHGWNGQDQSSYSPSNNRLSFGEGGVDDAEDADVLLHEYGHAIQNSIVPGWGSTTQAQAMGEGFGDYWAVSYSASISSYRNTWVFNWDGHNPFWSGRNVTSTLGYNDRNSDIYHDGTIWASVWWLIRGEIGRTVTDTDFLKLHYSCFPGTGMKVAAQNAMQADLALYDGLHAGTLNYYFTLREFFTAGQYDVPTLTHTPIADQTSYGPYPLTVTVQSTSAIVDGTVLVKYGTGTAFDQGVVLTATGQTDEWGGAIPYAGPSTDIRYYIVATNTAGWPGASPRGAEHLFHEFHVEIDPSAMDSRPGRSELTLAPANPNPFGALTALRFELPVAGNARVVVYDVSGRAVRTLADSRLDAGDHALIWDGHDDTGQALTSGLYFVRLYAEGQTRTRKVMLSQ
ncbi:MAG: FlgD immunoglobulin-like domain containing protein [Candidatus Eisenbacteria bacterium]